MSEETLDARVDTLEREMHEVRKVLLIGNGQPSLVSQMSSAVQQIRSQGWLLKTTLGTALASLAKQFLG